MKTKIKKSALFRIKYILFTIVIFLGSFSNKLLGQCGTDHVSEWLCIQDPNACSDEQLIRDTILNAFEDYNKYPDSYFQDSSEVESLIIPVVFHIIHQCGNEYVSITQCQAGLDDVNNDLHGNNDELNFFNNNIPPFNDDIGHFSTFHFKMATVDPFGNATTGINRIVHNSTYSGTTEQDSLKHLIQWDPTKYLNVWVVNRTQSQGSAYAQYPSFAHIRSDFDGIVISHNYLSNIESATPFLHQRRHLLTHEVGHWLGLKHTWGDTSDTPSCNLDDDLCQTPNTIGIPAIVYPSPITFEYNDSTITVLFDSTGITINGQLVPKFNSYGGIAGFYDYLEYYSLMPNENGLPNSCIDSLDCDSNGFLTDRPDNIYNMMDYGAEFMFTKDQIKLMVTVLNCPFAGRNLIGRSDTLFIDMTQYASITTDSYFFIESDFDNDTLKTNGINLSLSEGTFTGNDFILEITPDLSAYGLSYEYNFAPDFTSVNIKLTGNLQNIPESGLKDISIKIDLNEVQNIDPGKSIYNASPDNKLTINGFEILLAKSNEVIHHNYFQNPELGICIDDYLAPDYKHNCYQVALGNHLVEYIQACFITDDYSSNPPMDMGFYLSTTAADDIYTEVLVNNTDDPLGIGTIPLLEPGTDIIAEYDYYNPNNSENPYVYSELKPFYNNEGMPCLYSETYYTDNLDKEGYIGFRFQKGCEQTWSYAWIKMSIDMINGSPTVCFLEGQYQNLPYPDNTTGNYIVGTQDCSNPEPINPVPYNPYLWTNEVSINQDLISYSPDLQGYIDSTNVESKTTLMAGSSYPIEMEVESFHPFNSYVFAFIDFYEPYGVYDYTEMVFYEAVSSPTSNYLLEGILDIPNNVDPGDYSIRIIHSLYKYNNGTSEYYINPCSPIKIGETEDYMVSITAALPDCEVSQVYDENASELPAMTRAETFITAQNQSIDVNENVEFLAGNYIELTSLFEAKPGCVFDSRIEQCTYQEPLLSENHPWLNEIVDPNDCCNYGTVTEYTNPWGFKYIFISGDCKLGELYHYNQTEGIQLFCTTTPNYDCLQLYSLSNPVVLWTCGSAKTEMVESYTNDIPDNETKQKVNFKVQPNPFNDVFEISYGLNKQETVTIELYSVNGRKVKTILENQLIERGEYQQTINTMEIPSGVYLIKLNTPSYQEVKKLIKL